MKRISAATVIHGRSPIHQASKSDGDLLRGFAPVSRADARVLILGSLPGSRSLAAGHYYGNPRNQFWHLISAVIGANLVRLDYPERLACLIDHGIALWDIAAAGYRRGSLDSALKITERSDLPGLVRRLPQLRLIAFNGKLAARQAPDPAHPLPLLTLPSSSPANTMPLAQKLARWIELSNHIRPG